MKEIGNSNNTICEVSGGDWQVSQTYNQPNFGSGGIYSSPVNAFIAVARIPLNIGTKNFNCAIKLQALVNFTGSASKFAWIEIVPTGGLPGSGTIIGYHTIQSTSLAVVINDIYYISADGKTLKAVNVTGAQAAIVGESSSPEYILSADFTTGVDILIEINGINNNRATVLGYALEIVQSTLSNGSSGIVVYGDSLVAGVIGTGFSDGDQYTWQLSKYLARPIMNLGIGGETADQIATRVVMNSNTLGNNVTVLQIGANDIGNADMPARVLAGLSKAISSLKTGKFLVLSTLHSNSWTVGTTNRAQVDATLIALAATYPNNYVNIETPLRSGAENNTAYRIPDGLHLNATGHQIVGDVVAAAIMQRGW